MSNFRKLICLKSCSSSRRCLSTKKLLLFGVICVVLYIIFHKFNLLEFPGRKMKKDLYNRDEVAVGLSNVEGVDHVYSEDDDKVTIAIVDQHQEGIYFFDNMESFIYLFIYVYIGWPLQL